MNEHSGTSPLLVLVGLPGAGKSTIARRLGRALNLPVVDSDELIEEKYGKSCGDIFSDLGEEKFREIEAEVVADALHQPGILALGGGAVLHEETRKLLLHHNVVWVDVSAAEGARRTEGDRNRPVLAAADPVAHYQQLHDQRRPFYQEVASFRVRTDQRRPQQVVADILGYLDTLD
ncbi:AAA family ATPase [Corynebacterium poyangense]|uniref:Shikimate kinase n=1 Tax=Corynebacterium poyangense TaxID=2684405 RepID=A0A7H0SP29_9CORY|nr:shikimate kinase [Corynebacterium poyangense]QNQ90304.1 AAA family ATPase [Corynebacterium poyangense]